MVHVQRLEGFYWVARERGYARAARAFPYPITQPGVHQQVSKLEAELGARLFERVAKDEVRLTAAGERLYEVCAPFFEALPNVAEELRGGHHGGTLRIDASGLVLRELLPEWIQGLRAERDDIRVDVEEIQNPDLGRLRSGQAHLLVDFFEKVPSGFGARTVAKAYTFVVLPSASPLGRRRRVDPKALADTPFVAYHPSLRQHRVQLDAVKERVGLPSKMVSASSVDSILAFVRAGLGYSVVPWLDPKAC